MNSLFTRTARLGLTVALLTAAMCGTPALAVPDYPARPITIIVPFSAGATADTLGRMVARGVQGELGQSVVVENRAGGGSTIGASAVARSAPDGYTLLLGSGSTHTVAPVVIKNMMYDPVKDFQPIALIGTTSYVVLVKADSPMRTLADLVAYGRANPQKLSFGSTGVGGAVHLATVMLQNQTGASFLHVPYRGGAPALADLLGGQIDFTLGTAESAGMVEQGKLRALAVLGPDRLQALPDVPTCIETGVPDCSFPVWNAIFAPAGTPEPVVAKLTAAVQRTLAESAVVQRLRELGYQPATGGAEALGKRVIDESEFMRKTAAAAGVEPQ